MAKYEYRSDSNANLFYHPVKTGDWVVPNTSKYGGDGTYDGYFHAQFTNLVKKGENYHTETIPDKQWGKARVDRYNATLYHPLNTEGHMPGLLLDLYRYGIFTRIQRQDKESIALNNSFHLLHKDTRTAARRAKDVETARNKIIDQGLYLPWRSGRLPSTSDVNAWWPGDGSLRVGNLPQTPFREGDFVRFGCVYPSWKEVEGYVQEIDYDMYPGNETSQQTRICTLTQSMFTGESIEVRTSSYGDRMHPEVLERLPGFISRLHDPKSNVPALINEMYNAINIQWPNYVATQIPLLNQPDMQISTWTLPELLLLMTEQYHRDKYDEQIAKINQLYPYPTIAFALPTGEFLPPIDPHRKDEVLPIPLFTAFTMVDANGTEIRPAIATTRLKFLQQFGIHPNI